MTPPIPELGCEITRPTDDAVYVNITGPALSVASDYHLVLHYNGAPVWDSDQS